MAFLQNTVDIITDTQGAAAPLSQFSGYLNAGATSFGTGGVFVFGNNSYGQLGTNSITSSARSSPILYSSYNWIDIAFLKNGQGSIGVREDNKIVTNLLVSTYLLFSLPS
jgi:hypothetical protein